MAESNDALITEETPIAIAWGKINSLVSMLFPGYSIKDNFRPNVVAFLAEELNDSIPDIDDAEVRLKAFKVTSETLREFKLNPNPYSLMSLIDLLYGMTVHEAASEWQMVLEKSYVDSSLEVAGVIPEELAEDYDVL